MLIPVIKPAVVCLFLLASMSIPASARSKASKEIPKASPTPFVVSHISLEAHNAAAGRAQGLDASSTESKTRITTAHTATVQITVVNLGAAPEEVTLRWFWVGRYERSRNWFRSGEGEKVVRIESKLSQIVFAENADIEGHDTKSDTEHYKSGGNALGWVVTVSNSSREIVAIKASDPALEGFATHLPPKMRH